jgi:predicted transcriptional regulator
MAKSNVLGDEIARCRMAVGLSQTELAELSGTSQTHISRIECGRVGWTPAMIGAIAEVLARLGEPLMLDLNTALGVDVAMVHPGLAIRAELP